MHHAVSVPTISVWTFKIYKVLYVLRRQIQIQLPIMITKILLDYYDTLMEGACDSEGIKLCATCPLDVKGVTGGQQNPSILNPDARLD